jgi:ubiquinone biosynthesis protein
LTTAVVHLWRLARWGRTLARHGALLGIEREPNAPPIVRRLARLARFGARVPKLPRYGEAFVAIGPAAIKLGQALATRPDLVGDEAARDLMRLQDSLPPAPFAQIEAALREAFDVPLEALFASIDPEPVGAASIAQVHKAVTSDGRTVAVKVLRPGVEDDIAAAIETYEWAAAKVERMGGEAERLRPRIVIATFKRWTNSELNLRMEAAAASELAEDLTAESGFFVPGIDWTRTSRRVLTMEWIDGIKLTDTQALDRAGYDRKALAALLVKSFLRQAIAEGFFHADLHQGNLFAVPAAMREPAQTMAADALDTSKTEDIAAAVDRAQARIAAIDFGIMGRINRIGRIYLAEIIYGLFSGNYRRVAEIHFEAGYVPAHHNIDEFATALRAVGEPIRGLPVKDISIANLLDGLFAITRSFEMPTQPHLLLLQKTMVMVEGVALALDPDVNMWEISEPFVREWMRDELGPEGRAADAIVRNWRTLGDLPDFVRRVMRLVPPESPAPPLPPLPEIHIRTRQYWPLAGAGALGLALGLGLAGVLG